MINVVVFVCIFAPSSSIKAGDFTNIPDMPVPKDFLDEIKALDVSSAFSDILQESVKLFDENIKQACIRYNSQDKKWFDKEKEMIAKFHPFKNLILTPASLVWIQVVSVTGMFVTGILLILYLFNFIAKFSKIPWNFFEMVFCAAMSFFYFTCGLDLFLKGSKFSNLVTKCFFPKIDYFLTYGTATFCFFGLIIYGIEGIMKLIKLKKWC